jgi:hypothetical protein
VFAGVPEGRLRVEVSREGSIVAEESFDVPADSYNIEVE